MDKLHRLYQTVKNFGLKVIVKIEYIFLLISIISCSLQMRNI